MGLVHGEDPCHAGNSTVHDAFVGGGLRRRATELDGPMTRATPVSSPKAVCQAMS
jgi:hypothetical protein